MVSFRRKITILNHFNNKKCLQPDKEPATSPQAAPKKVIEVIMQELNQIHKDKGHGHLQSQPEGLQQCIAAQRVPDPYRSVKKLHELIPDCKKTPGSSQHGKLLNGWHPLMEKKNIMLLTAEWRKNNPPPPKQVPRPAPVASSSNSNVKKQTQAQNKGKGKAPAPKPYSQGYRIPKIQQDTMENVFQMARTMMELQTQEEARLRFQR
ncbi:hypothetical protein O181_132183 [Austropuccinia psidii MF-1]|uniref:Uncharacterized protein n=1 Tax=Austropuccinia psidii MF-1 TaxID=1389203 RepID=A0A9Q3L1V1_9BASI|nr:hypothetical protein [Austropuccinia psidii MF-1]